MDTPREDIDTYYARIAREVASRSTCRRRNVGAVLVQDKYLKGTGYNGAPAGVDDCLTKGCLLRDDTHCVRCVHAEANVILQSDYSDRQGATIYTTDLPCYECCKLIVNSGIARIVYERDYPRHHPHDQKLCDQKGIRMEQIEIPGDPMPDVDDYAEVPYEMFEES